MDRISEILDYWFEGITDQTPVVKDASPFKKWFAKDEKVDREIRERFESDLIRASQGQYQRWENSPKGRLALIILFDQFSRNIYRDTPKMFETDSLALELSLRSIKEKIDADLQLIERMFLYMPFMHSEDFALQKLSLQCFENLVSQSQKKNPRNTPYYQYTLDFARRHHIIIEKLGRFPHRNSILKRSSTKEELEFLQNPGSKF